MKVKGKRIISSEEALEFANSIRGQYIISHALVMASSELEKYEIDEDKMRSHKSDRLDMEFLLKAFPLFKIHEESIWKENDDESNL